MDVRTEPALPTGTIPGDPARPARPPFLRIYLLALALRLSVAILLPNSDPGPGEAFARYAVRIATGDGFGPSALLPPGYPYFLAWLFRLQGSAWTTIILSQAILSALTTVPVLLLAQAAGFGRGRTYAAGLLVALLPAAALETGRVSSVPLASLVFMTAAWLALRRMPSPNPISAVAAGLLWGAAVLTRSGIILPAALLLLAAPRRNHLSTAAEAGRETWIRRGLVLAMTILVTAPWCVRNSRLHERPVLIETTWGLRLRAATVPAADPYLPTASPRGASLPDNLVLSDNDLAVFECLGYAADRPGDLARLWSRRLAEYISATSSPGHGVDRPLERRFPYRLSQALVWGGLLTLVAAWGILRGMPGDRERGLFAAALGFVLLGIVTDAVADARLLTAPLLAIPAARGLPDSDAPLPSSGRRRLFRVLAALLWIALLVAAVRG